ncbi:hypothetical protein JYK14_09350 [Siccirubricoccus sp. KC 17139]|uniref:Uncharacterized protein n=1 Tax=Siccirubricoccus soli TaxID=2899147 RepID=A0ABT1D424_9PROT|nr:hypothetical protein [Siccirubricoccus soli]MCO6416372.1 hypothetical protein [Siccirubricoccus soli]MCP2682506.1 hypothetical protein [Siccirubricoccus soli]
MTPHLYSVGQNVEFVPGRYDTNVPRGLYTVVRQLPGPPNDREYRVKHQQDGHERVVLESQLRSGPPKLFA